MSRLNFGVLEKAVGSFLAFGKKNKTSIMTGGGVALGWAAVYVFWKESKKAEEIIRSTENKEGEEKELTVKEKAIIYAECCWPSLLLGVASSGMSLYAHKLDMDDIAKGYLATQFFKDKSDEKDKLIEKLKEEVPDKKVKKIEDEMLKEKFPQETIGDGYIEETGKGTTLFITDYGNIKFRSSIADVTKGIYEFKNLLRDRRDKALKRTLGDAFYSSDSPYPDPDIYASEDLDVFLEMIGVKKKYNLGNVLEFRDYGRDDFMSINYIMDYEKYIDPVTGVPPVCFLKIEKYLRETFVLSERGPY